VDLISTPHILTTTNEEATIQVGQNVPFIAGTNFAGAGIGIGFPVQNIQRQDVALTLKIKPQVNAGERVKLEIDLELTEIAGQNRELGPTTTKRKVKTTVRVQDNQTVVIGGLMRDRTSEGVSKVPILGDIPLIGNLFRVKNKSIEKRNLLIFMTPHIVLNSADFQKIFRQKMKERQEFLETFYAQKYKELQDRAEMRPTGALDQMLVDYDRRRREETKALQEKEQSQQVNQKRYLRPRHEEISIRRGTPKKEGEKAKKEGEKAKKEGEKAKK
jgi:type II secretory pathway component GspD/PulD (secretin)